MSLSSFSYWVTFASYEFNRDEADVVNSMASLVKGKWYSSVCCCGYTDFNFIWRGPLRQVAARRVSVKRGLGVGVGVGVGVRVGFEVLYISPFFLFLNPNSCNFLAIFICCVSLQYFRILRKWNVVRSFCRIIANNRVPFQSNIETLQNSFLVQYWFLQ